MSWRDQAKCRRSGPLGRKVDRFTGVERSLTDKEWNELQNRMFFPPNYGETAQIKKWKAETKMFCDSCPVRLDCLQSSLPEGVESTTDPIQKGIWGGMDEGERKRYVYTKKK